jgi:signal transduction histidine kinase
LNMIDYSSTCPNKPKCPTGMLQSPLLQSDSVVADKFKMDQVLRNLISNGLKFTPKGGKVSIIAYFMQPDDGGDRVSLRETEPVVLPLRLLNKNYWNRVSAMTLSPLSTPALTLTPRPDSWRRGPINPILGRERDERLSGFDIENGGGTPRVDFKRLDRTIGRSRSHRSRELKYHSGWLVVEVIDSGVGMTEENQKRLFKEIVQFSPEKLQAGGGSGLGLWITKGIIDLHGGKP